MILKQIDDKSADIALLESAISNADGPRAKQLAQDLRNMRAGIRAEKEAAYHIDYYLKGSENSVVLHDLRFVIDGQVTQIDHLILHRSMNFFVVETKSFHSGVKITDEAEFLRWNNFSKKYEGMPSPIEQNARHVHALEGVFARLPLPSRFGSWIVPDIRSIICVNPNAQIIRSKRVSTVNVVKADQILNFIDGQLRTIGFLTLAVRRVELKTIIALAEALMAGHRPRCVTPLLQTESPAVGDENIVKVAGRC